VKIDELQQLMISSIPSLYKINMSSFLTRKKGTVSLDFTNRLLIFIQDRAAMDVKSEYKWMLCGRRIKDNAYGINIVIPKYKTTYMDAETGNVIDSTDLTPDEFNRAFKLGIIQKEIELIGYNIGLIYDIRDTFIYDKKQYDNYVDDLENKEIKLSNILQFIENTFNINITNGENTEYSKDNLVIGNEDPEDKINRLIEIVSDILSSRDYGTEFREIEIEFIKKAIEFSLRTYNKLNVINENIDLISNEVYKQLIEEGADTDRLIDLMNIIESSVNSIIDISSDKSLVSVEREHIIGEKAARILNILEANIISKRMRGGDTDGFK